MFAPDPRDALAFEGYAVFCRLVPDRLLRAASEAICSFDLVIWSARLPHQGGRNRGTRPRVSQAVSMHPEGSESEREARIACWREKRAPAWWRGWKRQVDPEPGQPAELTALGRRLVGIDRWP